MLSGRGRLPVGLSIGEDSGLEQCLRAGAVLDLRQSLLLSLVSRHHFRDGRLSANAHARLRMTFSAVEIDEGLEGTARFRLAHQLGRASIQYCLRHREHDLLKQVV